jgi:hypothetical protein
VADLASELQEEAGKARFNSAAGELRQPIR